MPSVTKTPMINLAGSYYNQLDRRKQTRRVRRKRKNFLLSRAPTSCRTRKVIKVWLTECSVTILTLYHSNNNSKIRNRRGK